MAPRLTARDHQLRAITERDFQKTIEQTLTANGWRWYHAPDNRPGRNGAIQNVKAGFPDLFAVRGNRAIAIELKRELGKTSPDQDAWLADLGEAGIEAYVWRPSDINDAIAILASQWRTRNEGLPNVAV